MAALISGLGTAEAFGLGGEQDAVAPLKEGSIGSLKGVTSPSPKKDEGAQAAPIAATQPPIKDAGASYVTTPPPSSTAGALQRPSGGEQFAPPLTTEEADNHVFSMMAWLKGGAKRPKEEQLEAKRTIWRERLVNKGDKTYRLIDLFDSLSLERGSELLGAFKEVWGEREKTALWSYFGKRAALYFEKGNIVAGNKMQAWQQFVAF